MPDELNTLSPRAKMLKKRQQGSSSKKQIFKKKFRDMAMNQFMSEMPKIGDQVSGFRILEADIEDGSAIGTFVISKGENPIVIPAILGNNELKPFDIMFAKGLDIFLPLTREWIKELVKIQKRQMGESVDQPEQVSTDKDIRNVVIPPSTGRYSYASKGERLMLPAYLEEASNQVKEAFMNTLKDDPEYAERALNVYGKSRLKQALTPHREKEAAPQDVTFVTIETPEQEIKRIGSDNPWAYKDLQEKGYAYEDNRTRDNKNVAVQIDYKTKLSRPADAGMYKIFLGNGKTKKALIIPGPFDVKSFEQNRGDNDVSNQAGPSYDWTSHPDYGKGTLLGNRDDRSGVNYLGYTTDGEIFFTKRDFVAERISIEDIDNESFKNMLTENESDKPANGDVGFFFDQRGSRLLATTPFKIKSVSESDGVTNIVAQYHRGMTRVRLVKRDGYNPVRPKIISDADSEHGEIGIRFDNDIQRTRTQSSADITALIPDNYKFIRAKRVMDPDRILKRPTAVEKMHIEAFKSVGADPLTVKEGGAGDYWVDGTSRDKLGTVKYLVDEYNLRVPDAEDLVDEADRHKTAQALGTSLDKIAALSGLTKEAQPSPASQGLPGPHRGKVEKAQKREQEGRQEAGPQQPEQQAVEVPAQKLKMMQKKLQQATQQNEVLQQAAQDVMSTITKKNKDVQRQLKEKQENLQSQILALKSMVKRVRQLSEAGGEAPEMTPEQVPTGPTNMDMSVAKDVPQKVPGEAGDQSDQKQLFDTASVASIAEQNAFEDSVSKYMPLMRDSLDSIGRMLINMRTNRKDIEEQMGRETYKQVHQRLSNLFKNYGEMLISLNESTAKDMSR